MAADIWGMTDRDGAVESTGADRGSMELSNIAGAGDPGNVAATNVIGGARVSKDWGDASVTERSGRPVSPWRKWCDE